MKAIIHSPSDIVSMFLKVDNTDSRINESVESVSMELDWSDIPDRKRAQAENQAVQLMLAAGELLSALKEIVRAFDTAMGKSAVKLRVDLARDLIAKIKA